VDDVSVAICLLALVAVVLIGGVVALFSAVTTVLPSSGAVACRTLEACVDPDRDTGEAVWFDPERPPDVQHTR
jgi:predicted ribosomally synthesized peptide with SipW-like signal peptide